jgi:hypothetical protein
VRLAVKAQQESKDKQNFKKKTTLCSFDHNIVFKEVSSQVKLPMKAKNKI